MVNDGELSLYGSFPIHVPQIIQVIFLTMTTRMFQPMVTTGDPKNYYETPISTKWWVDPLRNDELILYEMFTKLSLAGIPMISWIANLCWRSSPYTN